MTRPAVLDLLTRLEAAGVRLALNESGDGLRVYGEGSPRPEVLEEVKTLKPALLAFLRGDGEEESPQAQSPALPSSPDMGAGAAPMVGQPDPAPWEDVQTLHGPEASTPEAVGRAAPLPDWAAISAQAGRCGSCARAEDVSQEWGRYMVRCLAPDSAWWPSSPPLALHIGAQCGAYLQDGEEVGGGWRSKEAAKTWGSGQARRMSAAGPAPTHGGNL